MGSAPSEKKQDRVVITLTLAVVATLVIGYGAFSGWGEMRTIVAVGLVFGVLYAIVHPLVKRRRQR